MGKRFSATGITSGRPTGTILKGTFSSKDDAGSAQDWSVLELDV